MLKKEILDYMRENNCDELYEIPYKNDVIALKFYYEYDNDEIEAAKAYANSECIEEKEGEVWYNDFFFPYLHDIATDEVEETIEDLKDDFNILGGYIGYELNEENFKKCKFIAVLYDKEHETDIEDVINDLNISDIQY